MRRVALLLVPLLAVSLLTFAPASPAQAELPVCAPWLPRPVRDGRFVRGRHSIFCNTEMVSITVVGILTRTYDRQEYFEIKRKIKTCPQTDNCTVKTRGTMVARRRQWYHSWARGVAVYQCKPKEVRYCTRRERRERERKRIHVTKTRSQCLLVGGSAAAMRSEFNERRATAGDTCEG
ncbi:MAG: hypothetical protein ACRDJV_09000 [Actinomycetota bacterium]